VQLFGFIIRICHDARSSECHIRKYSTYCNAMNITDSRCPLLSSSSATLHRNVNLQDHHHHHFITLVKKFELVNTYFIISSNPIFNIYYILQYSQLDVRSDLVHNFHGIVICISYYDYVLSLKMAFIAETCCSWLLIDRVVIRLELHMF